MTYVLLKFCEEKCGECEKTREKCIGVVDHHPAHDCWGCGESGYEKNCDEWF